ncbi:MAG: hypothetical protein IJW76_06305 [Clostridia bacterium]|nr:hypothetical protein [Clostridia bacterium]
MHITPQKSSFYGNVNHLQPQEAPADTGTDNPLHSFVAHNDDDLFQLFRLLIRPLQDLENLCCQEEEIKQQKIKAYNAMHPSIFSTILTSIVTTIFLSIPFGIIFSILSSIIPLGDGTLFDAFDKWAAGIPFIGTLLDWVTPSKEGLLWIILGFIVLIFMEFIVLPNLLILFPITLIVNIIILIVSAVIGKREYNSCVKTLEELKGKIDFSMEQLSIPLNLVPPNYRHSAALIHFCNSYANRRASTVKEAIECYETDLHRKKVEDAQNIILQNQLEIAQQIQSQNDTINDLQQSVKKVKNKVDWL